jgi:pimeloyl-ACP methyl ester carboxylesterase
VTVLQCDLGDGARMPYLEIDGPAEPPLLVLRGLGDALATVEKGAEKVRARYAPLGRRVLVPSWRMPARPGYRLADMTRDALAFVRALDLAPAAIWGNSMGGMVALLLAAEAPEAVRGIVAECTPIAATAPLTTNVDRWDRMAARRQWSRLQRDTLRRIFTGRMPWRVRMQLPFTRFIPVPDDQDRWLVLSAALREYDLRARAAQVTCPVLVIGGRDDVMALPEQQAELAESLPRGRLVLVDDCGHGAAAEQPERFLDEIGRFLADLPAPRGR